jgi:cysteine desulfurase
MDSIYLDNNATTSLLPDVLEALDAAYRAGYVNPASQHAAGRRARRALEEARERIGALLGARVDSHRGDQVIFTSGGTEANNLAIRGIANGAAGRGSGDNGQADHLLVSAIEHPSVLGAAERLRLEGFDVEKLLVDREGCVDPAQIATRLRPTTRLVSVMLGNNETGVIQPVAEISRFCREHGVATHTDAVQAVGKIDVDFTKLGVDAMTIAPHKFHGPLGIGALIVRSEVALEPLLSGGVQQAGIRPGTESVPLALGFAAALEAWHREGSERTRRLAALRDQFEARLAAVVPEAVFHSRGSKRLPQTSCVALPGVDRQAMLLALDQAGICCSTGSACASGSSEPSPTLVAMGCSAAELQSSLRFSVGVLTTLEEVFESASRISRIYHDLRRRSEERKIPVAERPSGRLSV